MNPRIPDGLRDKPSELRNTNTNTKPIDSKINIVKRLNRQCQADLINSNCYLDGLIDLTNEFLSPTTTCIDKVKSCSRDNLDCFVKEKITCQQKDQLAGALTLIFIQVIVSIVSDTTGKYTPQQQVDFAVKVMRYSLCVALKIKAIEKPEFLRMQQFLTIIQAQADLSIVQITIGPIVSLPVSLGSSMACVRSCADECYNNSTCFELAIKCEDAGGAGPDCTRLLSEFTFPCRSKCTL